MNEKYVLLIPGLGDHNRTNESDQVSKYWLKHHNININRHEMNWENGESFELKHQGVLSHIDSAYEEHGPISIYGYSAGSAEACLAFSERKSKIASMVLSCSALARPEDVNPIFFKRSPAFKTTLERLPSAIENFNAEDLDRILYLRPIYDQIIKKRDMAVPGAHSGFIPSIFHAPSILLGLSIFSRQSARFIKDNS